VAAVLPAPALAGPEYVLQLNAFKNRANAEKFLETMKARGLSPYIAEDARQGWHRVRLGSYATWGEARQAAQKLATRFKLSPVVMVALENPPSAGRPLSHDNPSSPALKEPEAEEVSADFSDKVVARFLAWRKAWQERDVSNYLSFYSEEFQHGRASLDAWKRQRERALSQNGDIEVAVQEIQIVQKNDRVEMSFIQNFKSRRVADTGFKTLTWRLEAGVWKIIGETWSPV